MTQLFLIAKQKGEKHNMTKTTKRNWKRLGLTAGLGLGVSLIAAGCGAAETESMEDTVGKGQEIELANVE